MKPGEVMGDEHAGMDMPTAKNDKNYTVSGEFKAQLSEVLSSYLALKDALVADDETTAKKEAKNMKQAIENTDMGLLKGDAHMAWMGDMNALNSGLDEMIAGADLEKTRMAFSEVSNKMAQVTDEFGLSKPDGLYLQYCPMADAYWISDEDAIRNPYYGSGMLKCGEVKKTY
jgi:Cu(I)/Ag(I) efflux system membrane fusion protein